MRAELPVGFQNFHPNRFFNLQLNRWYSLGFTRLEDLQRVAAEIKSVDDYTAAFVRLAEAAEAENRLQNAAYYFRAAEFLTKPSHPEKIRLYDKFIDLFYTAFKEDCIERHKIAFEGGFPRR